MADRLHLRPKHRRALEALLRTHLPDVEVWAYGSRVTGRSHDGSDLDLALRGPELEKIPADRLGDFEEAVRESNIPFLVEAHDWARLPERFHREIDRNHVVLVGKEEQHIDDGWCETTLGQVIELKRGYDLPQRDRIDGAVPVVSSSGVIDYHRQSKVSGPGVVMGRYGTLGHVFFTRGDFWPLNTALYVRDFKGNDPRFISYFLEGLDVSPYSDKAAVPGLNRNHLHQETVRIPSSTAEQRAIARVLGTLDDKIELNRRMNETLEAMARALFQSWFVDFEPVRAKMEGHDPCLPPHLAHLFPDRLVDSQLGEIPEEWAVGCLADVAESPRRGANPVELDANTPYIGLEHMPRRSIALTEWENCEKVTSTKSAFKKGEFLFGKLRPYFHKVGLAPVSGICSTDIVVVAPKNTAYSAFVLAAISSVDFVGYADQTSTGTKMPRTSPKTMSRYPMCLPPEPVARAFQDVAEPILDQIIVNIHDKRALATLRDTLLPRLISGEVRVRDAERVAEAVS